MSKDFAKAGDDGLVVIMPATSTKNINLPSRPCIKLGAEVVANRVNDQSRKLKTPGKSVDRHLAVLRRKNFGS